MTVRIVYLAEHPGLVPHLVGAYLAERGDTGADTRATAEARWRACQRVTGLPLGLLALEGDALRGAVALLPTSVDSRTDLGPWLGALFVLPAFRRQGVGTALVRAAEVEAHRQGFPVLYAGTHTADGLFTRCGWEKIDECEDRGLRLAIYRRLLPARTPASESDAAR
jgi:GNAT superfamily N-acetyltransferase